MFFVCLFVLFEIFLDFELLEACVNTSPLIMILVQEMKIKIELSCKMSHYIISMLYPSQVGCIPCQLKPADLTCGGVTTMGIYGMCPRIM